MIQRVRQFFRAIFATMREADHALVRQSLSKAEQELFYAMHVADQVHARNVARTALALAEENPCGVDRTLLLRAALLHDVGRRTGDLDVWGKVFAVLAMKFFPRLVLRLMRVEAGSIFYPLGRALFVSHHHASIGAARLRAIGLFREAAIVERHHLPPAAEDAPELLLLRMADEQN